MCIRDRSWRPEALAVEIHPTALVAKGAELADGVSVGPYSIIGEHARIGARTQILSHVII